jgi:hypothetical protein
MIRRIDHLPSSTGPAWTGSPTSPRSSAKADKKKNKKNPKNVTICLFALDIR